MEITTEDIIDEYKNEYKQKLINYLNERLKNAKEQYNDEFHKDLQQYIKGEMDFIKILLIRVKDGEFDNDNL